MLVIENANVVLEDRIMRGGTVIVEGDRIAGLSKRCVPHDWGNAERFDARGLYVGPGFVDIHVHGGGGHMFYSEPGKAAEHFLRHGETTVLATLYYDLTKERFLDAIGRVKAAMAVQDGGPIRGFYMEGPYMNPAYGASPEKNCWKGVIRPEDYAGIVDLAGDLAKVWAVAPERDGVEDFVKYAKKVNPGARIAVGHSEATPEQIRRLREYGLSIATHCMDATGSRSEWVGTRGCGPDEACMLDDDMYAELICDSLGVHVCQDLIKLLIKVKGFSKVMLITDSFVSGEAPPDRLKDVPDLSFDAAGNLSGSRLTMDIACRNLVRHTGCTMEQAFLMASGNPARAIGMYGEIGSIAEGKRADFVICNEMFDVKHVVMSGRFITRREDDDNA